MLTQSGHLCVSGAYLNPFMQCPQCRTENSKLARFCNQCGQALPVASTPAQPAPLATNPGPPLSVFLIGCGVVAFVCVVLAVLVKHDRELPPDVRAQLAKPTPNPSPTRDAAQDRRDAMANSVGRNLRENGCPKCSAFALENVFVIKNPELAPKVTAALILSSPQVKASLKSAGFVRLRVYQDTSLLADSFEYNF